MEADLGCQASSKAGATMGTLSGQATDQEEMSMDGLDDLAMTGQPAACLARPEGVVARLLLGRCQDRAMVVMAPMGLPHDGSPEAAISTVARRMSTSHAGNGDGVGNCPPLQQ